jgi:thiamine-monophosphate kinase
MLVKNLGEFGLIEILNDMVVQQRQPGHSAGLLVDTGDDTAAWKTGHTTELFTTDTMVEGVHFTQSTTPWVDLGWKCLASNISDIAAMGGAPLHALITLGLPPETKVEDVKQLYLGLLEIGNKYGVAIIGGDVVRAPVTFITVSITGTISGQPLLRSAGREGDEIGVTGQVGGSRGGLRLLTGTPVDMAEAAEYLVRCHRRPEPAVTLGAMLAQHGVATAMDVSDGLADDLSKLCQASGLAARLYADRVPVNPLLKQVFPDDYLELALNGGEDYCLLFAAPPPVMGNLMSILPEDAAIIGELVAGEPGVVIVVDESGRETVAGRGGWDHFG